MGGLLSRAATLPVAREELRLGVILNGGVSLAVWMGGVVLEIDHLTRAVRDDEPDAPGVPPPRPQDPVGRIYRLLLDLAGSSARADVIAGTSAGGINGAALALSQVNPDATPALLRDVWVEQGRFESLLRQPFRGAPTSLLKGDEYFLPHLNRALTLMATGTRIRTAQAAPVDLTITATVLTPNQLVTSDSLGQPLAQSLHGARFHFSRSGERRRGCRHTGHPDPFSAEALPETAARLALAARTTASFPLAFEPSYVPVNAAGYAAPATGAGPLEQRRLRPDMACHVREWGEDRRVRDRSRFAVDGGLLANTPTRAALQAVESMVASGPVRRVMLLVYPHAPAVGADPADAPDDVPTVQGALGGIVAALTAQGSRTFVEELEQHNRLAAGRRGARSDILRDAITQTRREARERQATEGTADTPDPAQAHPGEYLEQLADTLYPHYARLRRWRAGRDLALQIVNRPITEAVDPLEGWGFERVRRAAREAQETWSRHRPSPYFPDGVPRLGEAEPSGQWRWGVTSALGVAEIGADLCKRLVWVATGEDYTTVTEVRGELYEAMGRMRAARALTDDVWSAAPLNALQPDPHYWLLRLHFYQRQMTGAGTDDEIREAVEALIRARRGTADDGEPAPRADEESLRARLLEVLLSDEHPRGSAGRHVRALVGQVIAQIQRVLPVLHNYATGPLEHSADTEDRRELGNWHRVFHGTDCEPFPDEELLTRLLHLEVVSTTVGDEATTGALLPVEVVQVSAQSPNAFAVHSRTGEDKLAGMSVHRFGGFLKRSWRVNDWAWGRVDAASQLCRVVLDPARVRRTARLSGYLGEIHGREEARAAARESVEEILTELYGDHRPEDARFAVLVRGAEAELAQALDPATAPGSLPPTMTHLADLFAWALHLQSVPTELPVLAAAIRADGVEGANARSRGEVFLQEQKPLLDRLERTDAGGPDPDAPGLASAALAAFDRAGIGREPLQAEGASDQMIRTATTAAAVAATVVDSDRSGLTAVKPVTRTMRGAMLLPYWVVAGLTGKGAIAKGAALVGLAAGAVFLALALLGALPEGWSGPAAALGASALLTGFGIGALRTGTMLHGLVLLTPVVPLVALALQRTTLGDPGAEPDPTGGGDRALWTIVIVLALIAGLVLIGSLPATTGSVWAALDRLADRQGVPPGGSTTWRRLRGLALGALRPLLLVLLGVLVWRLALQLAQLDWDRVDRYVDQHRPWLLTVGLASLVVGMLAAWGLGHQLRMVTMRTELRGGRSATQWRLQPLAHPAGSAAGWSVIYGAGYLALAAWLFLGPGLDEASAWVRALAVTAALLALVLGLVVPVVVPLRALHRESRGIVDRAVHLPARPAEDEVMSDMVTKGTAYRGFLWRPGEKGAIRRRPRTDGVSPTWRRPMGDVWVRRRIEGAWDKREAEQAQQAQLRD